MNECCGAPHRRALDATHCSICCSDDVCVQAWVYILCCSQHSSTPPNVAGLCSMLHLPRMRNACRPGFSIEQCKCVRMLPLLVQIVEWCSYLCGSCAQMHAASATSSMLQGICAPHLRQLRSGTCCTCHKAHTVCPQLSLCRFNQLPFSHTSLGTCSTHLLLNFLSRVSSLGQLVTNGITIREPCQGRTCSKQRVWHSCVARRVCK